MILCWLRRTFQPSGSALARQRAAFQAKLKDCEEAGDLGAKGAVLWDFARYLLDNDGLDCGQEADILELMGQALVIARQCGHLDRVGLLGLQLAEVLATIGLRHEAFQALNEAQVALLRVGQAEGIQAAEALREELTEALR